MMIKYKKRTSILLKDLSIALKNPIDLRTSEAILCTFFSNAIAGLHTERSIQLISLLPAEIKHFCHPKHSCIIPLSQSYFTAQSSTKTIRAILHTLEAHINANTLATIYACLPENIFIQTTSIEIQKFIRENSARFAILEQ